MEKISVKELVFNNAKSCLKMFTSFVYKEKIFLFFLNWILLYFIGKFILTTLKSNSFSNPYIQKTLLNSKVQFMSSSDDYILSSGYAYIGTMCRTDGSSTSIIEDMSDYQSSNTAAHELGHR